MLKHKKNRKTKLNILEKSNYVKQSVTQFRKKKYRPKIKINYYRFDPTSVYSKNKKNYINKNATYIKSFSKYVKHYPFNKRKYNKYFRRKYWYRFYYKGNLKTKHKWKYIKEFNFVKLYIYKRRFLRKFILAIYNKYNTKVRSKIILKYLKQSNKIYKLKKKNFIKRKLFRVKFKLFKKSKIKKNYRGLMIIFVETKNNFIVSCVNRKGGLIAYFNAGQLGFTGRKKTFPYTAQMCGKNMKFFLLKNKIKRVSIIIKSKLKKKMKEALRGFRNKHIKILAIFRRIPVTHNGVRNKKLKRK